MAAAPKMIRTRTPGIYKRGGRYVVVFRDQDGRQRKESVRTYDSARRLKNKRVGEVDTGSYAPASKVTFHEYALEWVDGYQGGRRGIRTRTRAEYRRDLQAYALRFFPSTRRLDAITVRDADQFLAWLLDRAHQGRKLAPRTVERLLVPVRLCFGTACRHGLVSRNPFEALVVPRPDRIDDDDEKPKALSRKQLGRFLGAVDSDWRLFFETLAATGARWSEASAWRRRDLDCDRGCLSVRRTLYQGEAQPPKTRYSRREIPLAPGLLSRLIEHVGDLDPDDLIFAASNGAPLRAENVWRRQLKPAAKVAGVEWIGFHTFRHTAASILFEGGSNAVQVQRFLGHHSAAFTLETYVHLLDEELGPGLDLDEVA